MKKPEQQILPLKWPSRYDAALFVHAPCNQEALSFVTKTYAQWSSPVGLIIGPQGSGKTHLLHVVSQQQTAFWLEDEADFKSALVSLPQGIVLVDDVDVKAEKMGADLFFHLYNAVITQQRHMLMTMQRPLASWARLPDLLSRLHTCPQLEITYPDEEMLAQAYQKLFNDRGLFVDKRVISYLVTHSERSFSGMHKIVDTIDAAALQQQRRVTIPLVQALTLFG